MHGGWQQETSSLARHGEGQQAAAGYRRRAQLMSTAGRRRLCHMHTGLPRLGDEAGGITLAETSPGASTIIPAAASSQGKEVAHQAAQALTRPPVLSAVVSPAISTARAPQAHSSPLYQQDPASMKAFLCVAAVALLLGQAGE